MADSPSTGTDGPLGVIVKIDGTQLNDAIGILSIKVDLALNRIPEARRHLG